MSKVDAELATECGTEVSLNARLVCAMHACIFCGSVAMYFLVHDVEGESKGGAHFDMEQMAVDR